MISEYNCVCVCVHVCASVDVENGVRKESAQEGLLFAFWSHLCTVETAFSPSIIHSLITPGRVRKEENRKNRTQLHIQYIQYISGSHVFDCICL